MWRNGVPRVLGGLAVVSLLSLAMSGGIASAAGSATHKGASAVPGLVSTVGMHDFNGDGHSDLLALTLSGNLYLYIGTDTGFSGSPIHVGTGWQTMKDIVAAGDWNGDGHADLIARTATGDLRLYYGTGSSTTAPFFTNGPTIGTGFSGWTIIAPGDWNGDGHPDLIAKFTDGTLKLYEGNGIGISAVSVIGTGWQNIKVTGPGDWNSDGHPDMVGRFKDGTVRLFPGNGTGFFPGPYPTLGLGWKIYTAVI